MVSVAIRIIIIYLLAVNLVSFALMGIDKRKAIKHVWRVPETALFLSAILGGSIGAWLGMYTFRHKTKHLRFVVGIPVNFVLQIGIICMILS